MPYVGSLEGSRQLAACVARRTLARLRRARRRLAQGGASEHAALLGDALDNLTGLAGDAAGSGQTAPNGTAPSALFGSALRALAASLEAAGAIAEGARLAASLPPGRRRERAIAALFADLAATPHLREVAPRQVPDAALPRRAAALARRLFRTVLSDLPLAVAVHAPKGRPGSRFALLPREDPEQALRSGELPLGGTPLVLRLPLATTRALTIEILPRALLFRGGDRTHLILPRASHHAAGPARPEASDSPRIPLPRATPILAERPLVAGSSSLRLARRLRSGPRALRVGAPVPGLAVKLGRALDLVGRAWPEAREEIHLFTEMVVPLDEPGTVSYSLATRPGVSYINVWKKRLLELADDLLHETAHHKLHAVEELEPLVIDEGEALWWSPWRSAWRPLRGIVHGCYTFSYGALLFARLLALKDGHLSAAERRFAAHRLLEEEASLDFALHDLKRAARQGRLAPAGEELGRELSARLAGEIRRASARAETGLARDAAGRGVLGRVERHHLRLAAMSGREPGESG